MVVGGGVGFLATLRLTNSSLEVAKDWLTVWLTYSLVELLSASKVSLVGGASSWGGFLANLLALCPTKSSVEVAVGWLTCWQTYSLTELLSVTKVVWGGGAWGCGVGLVFLLTPGLTISSVEVAVWWLTCWQTDWQTHSLRELLSVTKVFLVRGAVGCGVGPAFLLTLCPT